MKETRSRVALVADMDRLWAIGGYDGMKNLSTVGREIGGDCGGYTGLPTKNETSETTLQNLYIFFRPLKDNIQGRGINLSLLSSYFMSYS